MDKFEIEDLYSNRKYFDMFFTLPEETNFFFSPFKSVGKAICLFINFNNEWEIHDFKSGKFYDIVDAVMELHNVNQIKAEDLIRKRIKRGRENNE